MIQTRQNLEAPAVCIKPDAPDPLRFGAMNDHLRSAAAELDDITNPEFLLHTGIFAPLKPMAPAFVTGGNVSRMNVYGGVATGPN